MAMVPFWSTFLHESVVPSRPDRPSANDNFHWVIPFFTVPAMWADGISQLGLFHFCIVYLQLLLFIDWRFCIRM